MDRTQLVAATAAALFAVFLLGWFAGWLVHRLTRADPAAPARLLREAQAAHAAREADLSARLAEAEAETEAALDALRASRAEFEDLRDHVERVLSRPRAPGG